MLKNNSEKGHLLTKNSLILHVYIIFKLMQEFVRSCSWLNELDMDMDYKDTLKNTQTI